MGGGGGASGREPLETSGGETKMEMRKMMVLVALAFIASFAAAYVAAGWVIEAVTDHATEQVDTGDQTAVVIVEC